MKQSQRDLRKVQALWSSSSRKRKVVQKRMRTERILKGEREYFAYVSGAFSPGMAAEIIGRRAFNALAGIS